MSPALVDAPQNRVEHHGVGHHETIFISFRLVIDWTKLPARMVGARAVVANQVPARTRDPLREARDQREPVERQLRGAGRGARGVVSDFRGGEGLDSLLFGRNIVAANAANAALAPPSTRVSLPCSPPRAL